MAQQGVLLDQDQLCCSICLDLFNDPVTLPCGHSYCSRCIKDYWDQDEQKGIYSCPQCRRSFTPRPALMRSTVLAGLVRNLKETEGAWNLSEQTRPAGSELVTCDLQERICSSHHKLLEVFCQTDQQCICCQCTVNAHKGHDTVPAAAERAEKQSKLGLSQHKVQQRVQEREKELKEVQQAVESLQRSGQAAEQDCENIFTELICSVERRRSEVKELIRDQQRAAVSEAERLEQEIAELRRRHAAMEQLSHTEDHIHFLQSYQSVSSPSVSSDPPSVSVPSPQFFSDVTMAVSELREILEDVITGTLSNISFLEPRTRAHFLHYSCPLTLDPNTASRSLFLSGENRKVTYEEQSLHPDHPDRFTRYAQVLCREALSERRYWEVEWRGRVEIAVSYKDISRTDFSSGFGNNNKSWSLWCCRVGYTFRHDNVETKLSVPRSSRVGVYLDHKAGSLSFYSVSDTVTLLHKVQTTFTQPLYLGFACSSQSSAEIIKLW